MVSSILSEQHRCLTGTQMVSLSSAEGVLLAVEGALQSLDSDSCSALCPRSAALSRNAKGGQEEEEAKASITGAATSREGARRKGMDIAVTCGRLYRYD